MTVEALTGPEHFKAAEVLLAAAVGMPLEDGVATLAEAGVHATLAVAAAIAQERATWTPIPEQGTMDGYVYALHGWDEITRRTPEKTEENENDAPSR